MSSDIPCFPCLFAETNQNARKWCISCEEGLCEDCEKTHKILETNRDHQLILIDDCRKIEYVPIQTTCSDHDKKFEWFCKSHDQALCVVCLPTDHPSCSDVIPINVAATNARQSIALIDLQETIEVTLRNITDYINNRNTITQDIEKQEKDIKRIILNTRTKMNAHLDEMEEKLMQTLVSTTKSCKAKCNNFLQQFNKQEERLIKLRDQVMQMKEDASDLQVFFGTRQIEKLVMRERESIKTSTDFVYDYKFSLVLNSDIEKLSNTVVKEFGEIRVAEHTANLDFKELKIKQAQIQQKVKSASDVTDIELQLITKVKIKKEGLSWITGCAILPNRRLLFANNYFPKLSEYSEDGNYIHSIPVSACPYDITVLDSDCIAISYGLNRFFEIFNYRNSLVQNKISTGGYCCTVTVKGKDYISASNSNLVCSNCINNNVYCYNMHGQEVWELHEDSLQNPFGVANDRHGNVFVVCRKSRNLTIIRHDGKTYKHLLNLEEYSTPRAVCYNKDEHTLLVCNENGGDCALYKVLYT